MNQIQLKPYDPHLTFPCPIISLVNENSKYVNLLGQDMGRVTQYSDLVTGWATGESVFDSRNR